MHKVAQSLLKEAERLKRRLADLTDEVEGYEEKIKAALAKESPEERAKEDAEDSADEADNLEQPRRRVSDKEPKAKSKKRSSIFAEDD